MKNFIGKNDWDSIISGRLKKLHPEIRIKLWSELYIHHPRILKIQTPTPGNYESDIRAPENYRSPVNKKSGEAYPNCCNFHASVFSNVENSFNEMTSGLEPQESPSAIWIAGEHCSAVANKVVRKLLFTEYQIFKHIDSLNWYEEITDYIEANVISLRHLHQEIKSPKPIELYLWHLKLVLTVEESCHYSSQISKEKRLRLMSFINFCQLDTKIKQEVVLDLYAVYQKWLNTFPFDIRAYRVAHRKAFDFFIERVPVLQEVRYNPYLKCKVHSIHTEQSLVEYLVRLTQFILKQISNTELLERGDIRDLNDHRVELNSEKYRIKKAALLESYSNDEMEYVKIMKKWLSNEITYFEKIEPHLNIKPVSSDKWYNQAVGRGVKPEILKEVSDLFSIDEQNEVEKSVRRGISSTPKFHAGFAAKISVRQLALCYYFLEKAKLIPDDAPNGSAYGNSFKACIENSKEVDGTSHSQHKKAYYYVVELTTKKELNDHNLLNLEVVKRVFFYYPGIQKLIENLTDSLKEKKS